MSDTTVEPIVIAEFPKNKKETIRVSLTEYQGVKLLEIRSYYPTEDGMKPGKGICLNRSLTGTLRKAVQAAERQLKDERPVTSPLEPLPPDPE